MKTKQAFNLAEILMTLVIIGIVSAIALPGLRKNVNNKQYRAGMHKSYMTFSQAWNIIMTDNKGYIAGRYTTSKELGNAFIGERGGQQLVHGRRCVAADKCFSKLPKGPAPPGFGVLNPATDDLLLLDDGAVVALKLDAAECDGLVKEKDPLDPDKDVIKSKNKCGTIWIDLNGLAIPNTYSKDVYAFIITSSSIEPALPEYLMEEGK